MKDALDARALASFVKTSGKRGLHVYVPLGASDSYERVRMLALGIAEEIVARRPALATLEKHPAKRPDKIFIDYLRNAFGRFPGAWRIVAIRGSSCCDVMAGISAPS